MDDIEEAKLPEFFKQWAVIHGRCRDPKEGPDTIGRLKAKGCKVWTYSCAQFMVRQSILGYYRFYPWDAYMRGLDGFAFWTVLSPHGDDGWDSRDGYDDGLCWRGLDKKPVPTKMLEAVREGLEDVAYMDRLAKELEKCQKLQLNTIDKNENQNENSGGPTAVSAADAQKRVPLAEFFEEARALLEQREAIIASRDQKRLDSWRLAVGRLIDSLAAQ